MTTKRTKTKRLDARGRAAINKRRSTVRGGLIDLLAEADAAVYSDDWGYMETLAADVARYARELRLIDELIEES